MAVSYGQVTCPSNAATVVVAAANANTIYSGKGTSRNLQLVNLSAQDIYLGGDTALTAANGYLLKANSSINLTLNAGDAIYGRGASSSPVISYICTGT